MSRTLKQLFDFQKFEGNRELQHVIDAVHAKYAMCELSDEDLEMVSAAGVQDSPAVQNNREQRS